MVKFKLNRKGEFTIKTHGKNHCGTKPVLAVKYELSVICGDGSLDDRGFLFDQMKVDAFFKSLESTDKSCEQFCVDCSRKLYKQILSENGGCKIESMECTLSPEPFMASITFSYQAEEKKLVTKKKVA